MRLIMLCAAVYFAYATTRRKIFAEPSYEHLRGSILLLLAGATVLVVALQIAINEIDLLPWVGVAVVFEVVRIAGLDALVAGLVVGFVIADQHNGAERVLWPYTSPPNSAAAELIVNRLNLAKSGLTNLVLVVLLLLAAFPYRDWQRFLERFQGVKAAGFELSLGALATRSSQDGARRTPSEFMSKRDSSLQGRGFSSARIERLASLTYPAAADTETPHVTADPAAYLRLSLAPDQVGRTPIRQVQRDRAYITLLARGEEDKRVRDRLRDDLPRFGMYQEELLARMGIHIACVEQYVSVTGDRRLIQYEVGAVVQHLSFLARAWMEMERIAATRGTEDDFNTARARVKEQVNSSSVSLVALNGWITESLEKWLGRGKTPAICQRDNINLPVASAEQATMDEVRRSGFAPYLSYVAAHALSSMGAYDAGAELIRGWMNARNEVEEALIRKLRLSPSSLEERTHLEVVRWFRFHGVSEFVYLQAIGRASEPGVNLDEPVLALLVKDRFPQVLRKAGQGLDLEEWRRTTGSNRCSRDENRWRQHLVASYLSFLAEHLQIRNGGRAQLEQVPPEDAEMARMLSDIDWDCFSIVMDNPVTRLERRGVYLVYSAELRMNALFASGSLSGAERERLINEIDGSLRQAIADLERVQGLGPAVPVPNLGDLDLHRAIHAPDALELGNARTLRRLLDTFRSR